MLSLAFKRFFAGESAGGVVLALAALAALVISNSPAADTYQRLLQTRGELRIGGELLVLAKPLLVWINDLWMAVFFFLVGLEIKRELVAGELKSPRQALLPAAAALGGMAVPALIYAAINWGDPVALRGWAIPSATDIAFAIGVLMLLGVARAGVAEGVCHGGGHPRRPGRHCHHCPLLHRPAFGAGLGRRRAVHSCVAAAEPGGGHAPGCVCGCGVW